MFSQIRWGATLLALGAWVLWPTATRAAESASPKANLLLVTIDTLRADRVSAYGYTAAQTSATQRHGANKIVFFMRSPPPENGPSFTQFSSSHIGIREIEAAIIAHDARLNTLFLQLPSGDDLRRRGDRFSSNWTLSFLNTRIALTT